MDALKNDMKEIQQVTYEAYKTSGNLMALLDNKEAESSATADALDKMVGQFERGAVLLRYLCEKNHPGYRPGAKGAKPAAPKMNLLGKAEVNHYGWLHIELNALLPHCRYQAPEYLRDTIIRLLDEYESRGRPLPRYDNAMLIIDEHCNIDSRQVYDQDNKGWKTVPNVLKGRLIKDDDQFTLGVCLISTRSNETACHIYLIPREETGDFLSMLFGDYPLFP